MAKVFLIQIKHKNSNEWITIAEFDAKLDTEKSVQIYLEMLKNELETENDMIRIKKITTFD